VTGRRSSSSTAWPFHNICQCFACFVLHFLRITGYAPVVQCLTGRFRKSYSSFVISASPPRLHWYWTPTLAMAFTTTVRFGKQNGSTTAAPTARHEMPLVQTWRYAIERQGLIVTTKQIVKLQRCKGSHRARWPYKQSHFASTEPVTSSKRPSR
jgi:hypothetical protein